MPGLDCTDILGLRNLVQQRLGILPIDQFLPQAQPDPEAHEYEITRENSRGNLWLPLVLTGRGLLYGEIIAQVPTQASTKNIGAEVLVSVSNLSKLYVQPLNIADALRQPIYQLGQNLLNWICASSGVYLVQFSLSFETEIKPQVLFDRLIPFPDLPAIASVGIQQPNLFECHWRCLSGQPIHDLVIEPNRYFVLDPAGSVVPSC